MEDYPKLRHGLEAMPIQYEGKPMILVRDQLGFTDKTPLFSPQAAQLLGRMNGNHSLRDIQAAYTRLTGTLIHMEQLEDLVRHLDELLFLENDRFIRASIEQAARFEHDPVRRMAHAGKAYPQDPLELGNLLDGFFLPENQGPGLPSPLANTPLLGIAAPHIDINAGRVCYAHTYKAVLEARGPSTWVVLGTAHEHVDNCLALTLKDYETPFGIVPCDRDYGEKLLKRAPRDLLASEHSHRREHTIEFQALFLARYLPKTRMVPILCSFSLRDWEKDRTYLDQAAELLWELSRDHSVPVGLMASVDLAHIGPRYGDDFHPHDGHIARHRISDLELLRTLEEGNSEGFMEMLRKEKNERRVCGMAPLYILSRALEGRARGKLLHHGHAVVDDKGSFVTFAGMAFYPKS